MSTATANRTGGNKADGQRRRQRKTATHGATPKDGRNREEDGTEDGIRRSAEMNVCACRPVNERPVVVSFSFRVLDYVCLNRFFVPSHH